jgi:hypothetical protein
MNEDKQNTEIPEETINEYSKELTKATINLQKSFQSLSQNIRLEITPQVIELRNEIAEEM